MAMAEFKQETKQNKNKRKEKKRLNNVYQKI